MNPEFRVWNKVLEKYEELDNVAIESIVLTLPSCKVVELEKDYYSADNETIVSEYDATDKYELEMYSGVKSRENTGEKIYEGDIVYIAGFGNWHAKFPFFELYDRLYTGNCDDIGDIVGHVRTNPELLEE